MNLIFHFLFNYLFVGIVFGDAWNFLIPIIIASLFIDLTHLPYIMKVRKDIVNKRLGSECRTRFHEIYGLFVFSALLSISYFIVNPITISVMGLCLVLHFALDFISGKSMPFYPFSKKEVFLGMLPYSYRNKIAFELISTIIMGVFFWQQIQNFVL